MGDQNRKLMNEIEYLSRLINTHKARSVIPEYAQSVSAKYSTLKCHRINAQIKKNKLHINRINQINNCKTVSKKHVKSNPYKLDRTANDVTKTIYLNNNLKSNKFEKNKSFVFNKHNTVNQQIYKTVLNSDSSNHLSANTSKLQDLIRSIPVSVTLKGQSKSVSLGHPSEKSTILNNTSVKLPNMFVPTKIQEHNKSSHLKRKERHLSFVKINVPTIKTSNNVYSSVKLSKPIKNSNVLKTKYKVVNCDRLTNMPKWKQNFKMKQKKKKTVFQNIQRFNSPWKMFYKNQWNISGKCSKSMHWNNCHWKNPCYKQYTPFFVNKNFLQYKRRQPLMLKRKMYTIAEQVKKNPVLKSRMVVIGGLLYKASKTKLSRASKSPAKQILQKETRFQRTLLIRGIRYEMDSTGKLLKKASNQPFKNGSITTSQSNLKRVDLGGDTYIQTQPGVLIKTMTSQNRTFMSRVVNRSIHRVLAAGQKKERSKNNMYCTFYNRFGRCNKSNNCKYIHDPDKIAVCTRFLRGTCKVVDCPFSHKLAPEKMPVCSFYLQGRCNNDDCPYRHVKVSRSAEVCKDFLRGYCPSGQKCKKTHVLECPDFLHKGVCKNGKKCLMMHTERKGLKRKCTDIQSNVSSKKSHLENIIENTLEKSLSGLSKQEGIPVQLEKELSEQPSFILLKNDKNKTESAPESVFPGKTTTALRIRPLFLNKGTLGVQLPVSQVSNNTE